MASLYTDTAFECKRINKSYDDAERSSFFYPLIGALIMPLVIGLFFPFMVDLFYLIILLTFILIPFYITILFVYPPVSDLTLRERFSKYFTFAPSGLAYSNDLKKAYIPGVTLAIIAINFSIWNMMLLRPMERFVFPPVGPHTLFDTVISVFTSAFMHGSFMHLFGNMVFLWAFASALEPRIGGVKFIAAYFLSIIASNLVPMMLLALQDSSVKIKDFHSLGASGAVSGIMGLFAVRCFFARVKISLPFLFFPIVSVPIRVNGLLLCGLFFTLDLSSSVGMFQGAPGGVNYWAHVGGYLLGMIMGYGMGLHKDASAESVSVRADHLSKTDAGMKDAGGLYTDLLKENPNDESALRFFLQSHRFNQKNTEPYFIKLMQVLIFKDFKQALELFEEHYPDFVVSL
ncbi:MAG: rhomboid family intramembrane serine protease, partial [Desulfobacterales bacterium]|nr:rhomboid family intramembrane serine protease [Desulfobacterales bacterium]